MGITAAMKRTLKLIHRQPSFMAVFFPFFFFFWELCKVETLISLFSLAHITVRFVFLVVRKVVKRTPYNPQGWGIEPPLGQPILQFVLASKLLPFELFPRGQPILQFVKL